MIDSRPKKAKWIGRINCNWLKFLKSTQYGYEFSNDLKNITASTDDNSFNIFDNIKVIADSGYGVKDETVKNGIRECKIDFEQLNSNNKVVKECSMNVSQKCISDKCKKDDSEDEITYKVNSITINPSSKDGLPYSGGKFNLTGSANITKITKYPLYWCGTNKKSGEYSATTETHDDDITRDSLSVWSISNPINGDSITNGKLTYTKVDSSREIIVNLEYSGLTTSATLEQNYDTNTYDYDFTITPSSSLEWSGDESGSSVERSVTIICQKITNKGTSNEKSINIDFTYTFDGFGNFTIGKEKEGNINGGFIFSFYPSNSNFSENDYKGVLTLTGGTGTTTITLTQTKAEPKNSDDALMGKFILTVAFNLTQLEKDGLYKEGDKLPVYINHQTSGDRNDVEKVWYASSKNPTENGYSISAINMSNTVAFDFNTDYCQCMFDVKDDAIIMDRNGDKKVIFFVQTDEGSTVPNEIEWLNKYPFCIRIPDGYHTIDNASVYRNENLKTLIVGSGISTCISDCFAGLSEITDMYFGPLKAPTLEHDASQGYTFRDTTAKIVNNPSCIFHLQPSVSAVTDMNGYNENPDTSMYEDAETEIWKWPGCFLANVKEDPRWHNYTKEIDAQMVNALTQWWKNKKFDFDPTNALDIFNEAIFGKK